MLDVHSQLWAPGERHLANYETLAHRARNIGPTLRYMPIPGLATRCGESAAAFGRRFRAWERSAEPVADVFRYLHDQDPEAMIVDETPR